MQSKVHQELSGDKYMAKFIHLQVSKKKAAKTQITKPQAIAIARMHPYQFREVLEYL